MSKLKHAHLGPPEYPPSGIVLYMQNAMVKLSSRVAGPSQHAADAHTAQRCAQARRIIKFTRTHILTPLQAKASSIWHAARTPIMPGVLAQVAAAAGLNADGKARTLLQVCLCNNVRVGNNTLQ